MPLLAALSLCFRFSLVAVASERPNRLPERPFLAPPSSDAGTPLLGGRPTRRTTLPAPSPGGKCSQTSDVASEGAGKSREVAGGTDIHLGRARRTFQANGQRGGTNGERAVHMKDIEGPLLGRQRNRGRPLERRSDYWSSPPQTGRSEPSTGPMALAGVSPADFLDFALSNMYDVY